MPGDDAADVPLRLVAPAALSVAKSPQGRQEALSDHAQKLPDHFIGAIPLQHVQPQVRCVAPHCQPSVPAGVDVERHLRRRIKERAEVPRPVHNDEIMGPVHGGHIVLVVGVVVVKADVAVPALVDAPHTLPQTVDGLVRRQLAGKYQLLPDLRGEMEKPDSLLNLLRHRAGLHRLAVGKTTNHVFFLPVLLLLLYWKSGPSAIVTLPPAHKIFAAWGGLFDSTTRRNRAPPRFHRNCPRRRAGQDGREA